MHVSVALRWENVFGCCDDQVPIVLIVIQVSIVVILMQVPIVVIMITCRLLFWWSGADSDSGTSYEDYDGDEFDDSDDDKATSQQTTEEVKLPRYVKACRHCVSSFHSFKTLYMYCINVAVILYLWTCTSRCSYPVSVNLYCINVAVIQFCINVAAILYL